MGRAADNLRRATAPEILFAIETKSPVAPVFPEDQL